MFERIKVRNFKSLRSIDLELGRVNLLIGTNASGKSNFLEVLRFLQGLGNELTVSEILNGKPRGATKELWEGLRGGSQAIPFTGNGKEPTEIEVSLLAHDKRKYSYDLSFDAVSGKILSERLACEGAAIFEAKPARNPQTQQDEVWVSWYAEGGKTVRQSFPIEMPTGHNSPIGRSALVLTLDLNRSAYPLDPPANAATEMIRALSDQQVFDPQISVLKEFSREQQLVRRMGERGEDFAALVKTLMRYDAPRNSYVTWLRELTPAEVEDVDVITTPDEEVRFAIRRQDGIRESALVLSDGTLRFAALAAVFFQPMMPRIVVLEEVENHLHPARIRLLAELLLSQSKHNSTQVFATTHSPKVVDWMLSFKDDGLHVLHFYRNESRGETEVRPLPALVKTDRAADMESVGELMSEGWMEVPV